VSGVSGFLRVTGSDVGPDDTDRKTATATCTGGRVAIGGGYHLDTASPGDDQNLTVVQSEATSDSVWTVTVAEDDLAPGSDWSVQAIVQCAQMAP
jgi:hypothetical protein